MRLIDADALINDILTDYGCDPKYIADETIDGLKPYTDQLILERIGLQPTIDALPVVRCKDCKWFGGKYDDYCIRDEYNHAGEWFCADGERREG